jgi:peptide/nickel transport system permease protein
MRKGSVTRFTLGRLLATAGLLLALSFIVFALLFAMPGDPAQNLLGVRSVSPELLAQVRAQYHLDDPFFVQYLHWLGSVLQGDFGRSIRSDESVLSLLGSRVFLTLQLVTYAFVITVVVAVPLGVFSAWRAGGALDRGVSTAAIVGVGAPSYAVGLLLLYVFGVALGLFPIYGSGDDGLDRFSHLTLPAVTLAIGLGALVLKLTRTAVLAELDQDYVAFARSRGLPNSQIRKIVLRNALLPVITSLGLVFTFLFGGTILVEITFALQGIGSLLASSVTFKDVPVVQAVTLLTAAVIALVALAVDLLYFAVDPRVRKRAAS